jgi:hypothetical protein
MRKSEMSSSQISKYKELVNNFKNLEWSKPEHSNDFESNLYMVYELTSHKRYGKFLIRIQISFENNYTSLQVVETPHRNSEYFINFDAIYSSLDYLLESMNQVNLKTKHDDMILTLENFFADDEEIKLSLENIREVVLSDPANR